MSPIEIFLDAANVLLAVAYLLAAVYVVPRDDEGAYRAALAGVFVGRAPQAAEPGRLYVKRNGDSARHLLTVASGLASMVLGKPEIHRRRRTPPGRLRGGRRGWRGSGRRRRLVAGAELSAC